MAEAYRIIDADIIKDHLIRQAIADGIYDRLLAMFPALKDRINSPAGRLSGDRDARVPRDAGTEVVGRSLL